VVLAMAGGHADAGAHGARTDVGARIDTRACAGVCVNIGGRGADTGTGADRGAQS
jgi:hypothetical protein